MFCVIVSTFGLAVNLFHFLNVKSVERGDGRFRKYLNLWEKNFIKTSDFGRTQLWSGSVLVGSRFVIGHSFVRNACPKNRRALRFGTKFVVSSFHRELQHFSRTDFPCPLSGNVENLYIIIQKPVDFRPLSNTMCSSAFVDIRLSFMEISVNTK